MPVLYLRDDPYESSDAVFGVKSSLIVDLEEVKAKATAEKYGVDLGTKLVRYDFVLTSEPESAKSKLQKATEAMKEHGRGVIFINGLPIPDVDY